jgi:hypothetical protein
MKNKIKEGETDKRKVLIFLKLLISPKYLLKEELLKKGLDSSMIIII